MVLSKGFNFVFVCKSDSHKTLYRWVELLEEHGDLNQLSITRWNGKEREIYTYKYANDVPLRDSEDALSVSWVELTISKEDGQILYKMHLPPILRLAILVWKSWLPVAAVAGK